jgi:hypothetical protein
VQQTDNQDRVTQGAEGLTPDELVFVRRMLPHFMAGKNVVESARAVLDDDVRLFAAATISRGQYFLDGDFSEARTSSRDYNPVGSSLTAAITGVVYRKLRQDALPRTGEAA